MKLVNPSFEILLLNDPAQILQHIEKCGRTCYKSEKNITDESAKEFVKERGLKHRSMLEHYSVTVRITCDLGVSQENTRHRLIKVDDDYIVDAEWNPGVSQESTRFCNYSKDKHGSEITFVDCRHHFKNPESIAVWYEACIQAEKNYLKLIELGETPQFARSVLIRSTKTEMTLTANLRSWRDYLLLRAVGTEGSPHPQMREIDIPLLEEFKQRIPVIFDDIVVPLQC